MLYLNVASLVPLYFQEHHPEFDSLSVGILFASYQAIFICVAPLIGMNLEEVGRRKALFISIQVFTVSTLIYATSAYIESDTWFYAIVCLARVLQGIADAWMRITIPSIIVTEFPEKISRYQGYLYLSMGVGLSSGPLLTFFLQQVLGLEYIATFYSLSAFIFFLGNFCVFLIPSSIE